MGKTYFMYLSALIFSVGSEKMEHPEILEIRDRKIVLRNFTTLVCDNRFFLISSFSSKLVLEDVFVLLE